MEAYNTELQRPIIISEQRRPLISEHRLPNISELRRPLISEHRRPNISELRRPSIYELGRPQQTLYYLLVINIVHVHICHTPPAIPELWRHLITAYQHTWGASWGGWGTIFRGAGGSATDLGGTGGLSTDLGGSREASAAWMRASIVAVSVEREADTAAWTVLATTCWREEGGRESLPGLLSGGSVLLPGSWVRTLN